MYEMLAGEPPFTGPTAQAVLTRSLTESVRPLSVSRPNIPAPVSAVIGRALSKSAADRQKSSAQLAIELGTAMDSTRSGATAASAVDGPTPQLVWGLFGIGATASLAAAVILYRQRGLPLWTLALAALLLGVGAVVLAMTGRVEKARAAGASPGGMSRFLTWSNATLGGFMAVALWGVVAMSIAAGGGGATGGGIRLAVLPFTNRGAADDAYFVDGVADQIRGTLGNIPGFEVIARTSSDQYRETNRTPVDIGRDLNVQYLLAAWDTYLKSKSTAGTGAGQLSRRELLERAVALDSNFALAWTDLSITYSGIYFGIPSRAMAEASLRAAERARALAPESPETYRALGVYANNVIGDLEGSLSYLAAGLRLSPNHLGLLTAQASAHRALGRWEEVVTESRRITTLDPKSANSSLLTALLWLRRYPEAMAEADRLLLLHPTQVGLWQAKAMIHLGRGDLAGARTVLSEASRVTEPIEVAAMVSLVWDTYWALSDEMRSLVLRLPLQAFGTDDAGRVNISAALNYLGGDKARAKIFADSAATLFRKQLEEVPDENYLLVLLGLALAYGGHYEDAIRAGERSIALLPIAKDGFSGPYNAHQLARIYTLAGEQDRAIDQLEAILAVPYFISPGWLTIDPTWDALRGNPRFQRLASRK
jgi:tetratricopeptide (TPR) repeat protein